MLNPSLFDYDQQAPLKLSILAEREQDGALVQDIIYASPHGGDAPAYLVLPKEQPPQAGLLFGHWGEGNREEFVPEAVVLARLGFASLCLDAPYLRPAQQDQPRKPPEAELQWIVDIRRGIDVLLEHGGIAPDRLGYVGHSFGASYGGTLAGIERRIRAFVLMAGWYAVSELTRTSSHPVLVEQRKRIAPEVLNAYLTAIAPLDACHYIGHAAPTPLLFQYARHDPFVTVEEGQRYFELASEPKEIRWYENCGHELSAQARVDRVLWLCERLHLSPPAPEIIKMLEQLPPPTPLES
jgi:pimeloyl-ACP methyl ester carboxylesterase